MLIGNWLFRAKIDSKDKGKGVSAEGQKRKFKTNPTPLSCWFGLVLVLF